MFPSPFYKKTVTSGKYSVTATPRSDVPIMYFHVYPGRADPLFKLYLAQSEAGQGKPTPPPVDWMEG